MEENKGIVYKVAGSYCKNEEDRKDLVQEITVQLWRAFPRYNGQDKYTTWMYRIALNVAISFYRKDTRRKRLSAPLTDTFPDAGQAYEGEVTKSKIGMLQQFIAALKEFDRALMLLYMEDKSHREMAEILGISETNVSTKIARIKDKLKQRFANINY